MTSTNNALLMGEALGEARKARRRGDLGVGAVIVADGLIVGRGGNQAKSSGDSTAHAEVVALQDFQRRHPGRTLDGATLYTTYQPCPMCLGACLVTQLSNVVIGASPHPGESLWGGYTPDRLLGLVQPSGHRIDFLSGVLEQDCREMRNGIPK